MSGRGGGGGGVRPSFFVIKLLCISMEPMVLNQFINMAIGNMDIGTAVFQCAAENSCHNMKIIEELKARI